MDTDPAIPPLIRVYSRAAEELLRGGHAQLTLQLAAPARHDVKLRKQVYGEDYPVDEDFLKALEFGLPPCSGNALGLDRLVMLATGAADIGLVQAAPV